MKQVLQRLDSGEIEVRDVPVPSVGPHQLLIQTRATLLSAGTERMLVEFGRASLVGKARSQPDRVRQVLDRMRTDGIGPTLDAVRSKLADPLPLGYCNAGVVRMVGDQVRGFTVGDRVVSNGYHAEWVRVPATLAARLPDEVSEENACFTPLAAVALQGIRLAAPTLGETIVVVGLGLVGLLTVQLLRASGCRVIGLDLNPDRRRMAERFGAITFDATGAAQVEAVRQATDGVGADAVLLALSSKSSEPVALAAEMARQRGRLVLVGVAGLELSREPFFRKELQFMVSSSYGPGRYDPAYEAEGKDYPVGFVRWTAQRNFVAVVDQLASGGLDPSSLITHRVPVLDAATAYQTILDDSESLAVVLNYPEQETSPERTLPRARSVSGATPRPDSQVVAAVLGAGNFARRTLLPLMAKAGIRVRTVVSSGGLDASLAAEQVDAELAGTDITAALEDPQVNTVFVLTRHDSHARLAARALEAGKHVFVEKPLALTDEELDGLEGLAARGPGILTVGFNRRWAPLTVELERRMAGRVGPLAVMCTVNAGALPSDHWARHPQVGGGRILGEGCHFIDLLRRIVAAPIAGLDVQTAVASGQAIEDIAHLTLRFADGSIGTVAYLSNGARDFPKETVTCFADGRTHVLENWRRLRSYGRPAASGWPRRQNKGHLEQLQQFVTSVGRGEPPIPYAELFEVSRWSIRAGELARQGGRPAVEG